MARELDTPDAHDEVKAKVRELHQRASAADTWAREQEDALLKGQQAHDGTLEQEHAKVVPISGETSRGDRPARSRTSSAARAAGHKAYTAARPKALRIAHNGRQHFFQGLTQPFGGAGGDLGELLMEAIGLSVAVVLIADLLRAPGAITSSSSHVLGFFQRAVDVVDPFTGLRPAGVAAPRTAPARAAAPPTTKATA